jgi:hypothetical protein
MLNSNDNVVKELRNGRLVWYLGSSLHWRIKGITICMET